LLIGDVVRVEACLEGAFKIVMKMKEKILMMEAEPLFSKKSAHGKMGKSGVIGG